MSRRETSKENELVNKVNQTSKESLPVIKNIRGQTSKESLLTISTINNTNSKESLANASLSFFLQEFNQFFNTQHRDTKGRLLKYQARLKKYSPQEILKALGNLASRLFYHLQTKMQYAINNCGI